MQRTLLASCLLALPGALCAQSSTAYLVDSNLDQLFTVDLSTGAATFIASTLNNTLSTPADLAYDAVTQQLWTIDLAGGAVGTIDTTTGTFTPIYQTGLSGWQGMAWDPTTQKFYLANQNGSNYVLDPATSTTTLLGAAGFGLITALDVDASGILYGIDFSSGAVVSINKVTGLGTQLSTTITNIQGLGIDQVTGTWYGESTTTDSLYIIDPVTGGFTLIGANGAGVQFAKGLDLIDGVGGNFATKVPFGQGCNPPAARASFYENNPAFDMSNTSLQLINIGTGYLVQQGTATWHTPTSSPVTMGDDQVLQFALGWTLAYPGGSTTNLWISSNGFVNATANTLSGCCSFNLQQFLSNGPCWAMYWRDLYPPGGGTVTFESNAVTGDAWITFDQVPNCCGTSSPSSFQYQFHQSGIVDLVWGNCTVQAAGVGWSPGANNMDPGSSDLSALTTLITGPDTQPLGITGSARPVIGTSLSLALGNVPASTVLGAVIYGLNKFDPGIPLAGFGMPNCFQYSSQEAVALLFSSPYSSTFTVPNSPGLAGVHVIVQGAAYDPTGGHNAIGALVSGGIDLGIDLN
ncbi:MAG: hypothetical protein U1E73_08915 [Planctomycetota bacterium]